MKYSQVSIMDMVNEVGEDKTKNILSHFSCPLNQDVEDFLRNKAIVFAQQKIAMTFLIYASDDKRKGMVGYFTLANKFVAVTDEGKLSNGLKNVY